MSFMQLCQLLELSVPERPGFGTRDSLEHEPVRFRPRPRIGFPAGEVASVERDDEFPDAPPSVRTTFMGLYGVDAAMPSHLIDDIVLREEGYEAVTAFLDPFNHRLVTLLYRVWKKYRYPVGFRPGGTDEHSRKLLALAGFGWGDKPARAGLPDSRMLAMLGLLIQRTRTSEGLAGVIALTVPGAGIKVDEFFSTVTSAGDPQPLSAAGRSGGQQADGAQRGLGRGYVLGRRIAYRSKAVRVTLHPSGAAQAHDLLPGAPLYAELMAVLRLYIGVKADVHLRMQVSSRLAPVPRVAARHDGAAPRLAWTTVLPSGSDRVMTIPLGRYTAIPTSSSGSI
jgi:type VI secretion system protein ImpH